MSAPSSAVTGSLNVTVRSSVGATSELPLPGSVDFTVGAASGVGPLVVWLPRPSKVSLA